MPALIHRGAAPMRLDLAIAANPDFRRGFVKGDLLS
jgi:hypothetical protein